MTEAEAALSAGVVCKRAYPRTVARATADALKNHIAHLEDRDA